MLGHSPNELRDLRRAALLHDIGKLGVSNLILDKPGKLDAEEWVQMRRHPALTVKILERVGAFRDLAATAGAHHERLDGGGYHLGLTGDQLNRDARILAVADVCEALTAERPYRAALPPDEVRAIMRRDAGRALCPEALGALEASQQLGVLTARYAGDGCSAARGSLTISRRMSSAVSANRRSIARQPRTTTRRRPSRVARRCSASTRPRPAESRKFRLRRSSTMLPGRLDSRRRISSSNVYARLKSSSPLSATQTVSGARLSMVIPSGRSTRFTPFPVLPSFPAVVPPA